MTYVIAEPCVDVKDKSCIEECPVDCIYEGDRMLYINPDQCVDCGACEPVCPVESIYYEDEVPRPWKPFIAANAEFCAGLSSLAGHVPAPRDHPMVTSLPISMGWALILALSGLYLWWPRRSQKGKTLLAPRIRAKGRLKWRDLHAASGILALGMLLVFITTGMPWSAYWGNTLSAVNTTLTPGPSVDTPSTLAKAGDLDRFGKRIPWATQEDRVPASSTTTVNAGQPAKFSLTDVARAAQQEGMQPGYDIVLPINEKNATGQMVYGSYQPANPWPGRINTDKTIYLDQFSGKKLLQSDSSSSGAIGQATSFGVYTHMGTEFGLLDRIVMTTGALLLLVSIGTSLVMWWIRRPQGRPGLPKRPANPRLPWTLALIGLVVALIYPLWGVSVLVVIMLDWLVIRQVGRLRSAFGMPTATREGTQPAAHQAIPPSHHQS